MGGPAAATAMVIGTKESKRCFRMVAVSDGFPIQRNACHSAATVVETAIRAQALRIVAENG
ncbi:hypothetical protein C7S15_1433 [Burkholderia cepacia]|nr:hypothetical protein [Burkholderia cepacia]